MTKPTIEMLIIKSDAGTAVVVNATRISGSEPCGAQVREVFTLDAVRIKEALKSTRRLVVRATLKGGETNGKV